MLGLGRQSFREQTPFAALQGFLWYLSVSPEAFVLGFAGYCLKELFQREETVPSVVALLGKLGLRLAFEHVRFLGIGRLDNSFPNYGALDWNMLGPCIVDCLYGNMFLRYGRAFGNTCMHRLPLDSHIHHVEPIGEVRRLPARLGEGVHGLNEHG